MIGYHCNISIGSWFEIQSFFTLFEMTWLIFIGWIPEFTNCLPGGLT